MNSFLILKNKLRPLRIVLIYAGVSVLWIYFSDTLLGLFVHDPKIVTQIAIFKGLAFVGITAGLLHFLIQRDMRRIIEVEEALAKSRISLDSVVNGTTDAVYVKDLQGRYLLFNAAAERMVGKPASEVLGKDDRSLFPSAEASVIMEGDRKVLDGGVVRTYEDLATDAAGSLRTYLSTKGPLFDTNGKAIGLFGVSRDITERKKAEDELKQSEEKFRLLFQKMLNGFARCRMLYDENGRPVDFIYLDVNGAFETLTGLKNVIGKKVSEVIPGIREHDQGLLEIYGRVARTGQPEHMETYVESMQMWFAISVYSTGQDHFVAVFDVITERKRSQQQMADAMSYVQTLVNSSPIAIVTFKATGPAVLANAAAAKLVGTTIENVQKQNFRELDSWKKAGFLALAEKALATGQEQSFEGRVESTHGNVFWMSARFIPFYFLGEHHFMMMGIDITERIKVEEVLKQAREDAEAASKAKSEFLNNIAHDFRTPLHAIMGFSSILGSRQTIDEQQKFARIINDRCKSLLTLVEDLLDVSRLGAGKLHLRLVEFDLKECVLGALQVVEIGAQGKNINISCEIPDGIPRLKGDRGRLGQILMNVIGNAVKFTEKGTVQVRVVIVPEGIAPGKCRLQFSVKDTGIGMSAGESGRIFDPFTQFHEFSGDKERGGVGLGLYITKTLVDMMGGSLSVVSEVGQGSEFVIILDFDIG